MIPGMTVLYNAWMKRRANSRWTRPDAPPQTARPDKSPRWFYYGFLVHAEDRLTLLLIPRTKNGSPRKTFATLQGNIMVRPPVKAETVFTTKRSRPLEGGGSYNKTTRRFLTEIHGLPCRVQAVWNPRKSLSYPGRCRLNRTSFFKSPMSRSESQDLFVFRCDRNSRQFRSRT